MDNTIEQACRKAIPYEHDRLLPISRAALARFVAAYLEAIEFTGCSDIDDECGGKTLPDDLGDGELDRIIDDALRFIPRARDTIASFIGFADCPMTIESVAHDFWLTRNGHGAGFWDRDYATSRSKEIGEALSALCGWRTEFPETDCYLGDDGKVYLS